MNNSNSNENYSRLIESLSISKNLFERSGNIVSIIGVFFNLNSLCIIKDNSLNFKFYDFLWCRCFCNLVVCFFGIFFNPVLLESIICKGSVRPNYWELYLQLFFVAVPLRIALMSSAISDVLLILNRVALLCYNKLSLFYELSIKVSYFLKHTIINFFFR
jgi:hypothetical protein